MKRAFDITAGTLLALAALPIILVVAVAMAISLHAWPFFVQRRVGLNGRLFWFPKIRTLPASAPQYADKYAIRGVEVTRLGAFLRRTHLDELPQLFLVPVGKMSLIGPRPEMPSLAAAFSDGFARSRAAVRPGCTGLWQVSEACRGLIGETPEYDVFYVEHQNLALDLWILWRTVKMTFSPNVLVILDSLPSWARASDRAVVIDLPLEEIDLPLEEEVGDLLEAEGLAVDSAR